MMSEYGEHQIGHGSPFPGMNPYLEGELWQEFHDRLANQISEQLMPLLQPKYVALLNKRYVVDRAGLGVFGLPLPRVFYPDVHVVHPPAVKETAAPSYTVVAPPAVELVNLFPLEVPLLSVEIRDVAERRLVTVIEILSPANKHGDGFREYIEIRTTFFSAASPVAPSAKPVLSPVEVSGRLVCVNRCPRCPFLCCRLTPTCPSNCKPLSKPVLSWWAMSDCWTIANLRRRHLSTPRIWPGRESG